MPGADSRRGQKFFEIVCCLCFLFVVLFWIGLETNMILFEFSAIFSTWILKYNWPGPARADPRPSLPKTWSIMRRTRKFWPRPTPISCMMQSTSTRSPHFFIMFLKNIQNKPVFYKLRQQILVSFWSSRLFFHLGILIPSSTQLFVLSLIRLTIFLQLFLSLLSSGILKLYNDFEKNQIINMQSSR